MLILAGNLNLGRSYLITTVPSEGSAGTGKLQISCRSEASKIGQNENKPIVRPR